MVSPGRSSFLRSPYLQQVAAGRLHHQIDNFRLPRGGCIIDPANLLALRIDHHGHEVDSFLLYNKMHELSPGKRHPVLVSLPPGDLSLSRFAGLQFSDIYLLRAISIDISVLTEGDDDQCYQRNY